MKNILNPLNLLLVLMAGLLISSVSAIAQPVCTRATCSAPVSAIPEANDPALVIGTLRYTVYWLDGTQNSETLPLIEKPVCEGRNEDHKQNTITLNDPAGRFYLDAHSKDRFEKKDVLWINSTDNSYLNGQFYLKNTANDKVYNLPFTSGFLALTGYDASGENAAFEFKLGLEENTDSPVARIDGQVVINHFGCSNVMHQEGAVARR